MIAIVVSGVIVNANESKNKTKKHPREYLTLKIDSNAKTGGFFGGELGVAINNLYQKFDTTKTNYVVFVIGSLLDFRINLIGGYQWYFYNHPNFSLGVRAKGYLGYGYHKDSTKDNNNNYYYTNVNYFHIGSELQILWDFLNIDKHSLGIHFSPIGFDISVEVENKSYDTSKTTNGATNPGKHTDVYTTPSYTVSTGIHYYYDANHQLFLDYKYLTRRYDYSYDFYIGFEHQFTFGYSYKI